MAVVRRILDVTCVFNCKPYSAMYLLFLSTTIKAPLVFLNEMALARRLLSAVNYISNSDIPRSLGC